MAPNERAAEVAYVRMAMHFDGCEECREAGAELADPAMLCEVGRLRLERWLGEEFRVDNRRRVMAIG